MKQKILLFLFVSILFVGCKKGENDPFFLLKSRTARLCQKWRLSDGDKTTTAIFVSGIPEKHHYTFDGNVKTDEFNIDNQNNMVSVSVSYTQEIEFKKDRTYNITVIDNDSLYIIEGIWMWSQKKENLKKKEAVILFPTKETNLNYNYTYSGKALEPNDIFVLDKLSSKELILFFNYKYAYSQSYTYDETGTMRYVRK